MRELTILNQELEDGVTLITLELQDLPHVVVFDNGAIARVRL